jgi:transposase
MDIVERNRGDRRRLAGLIAKESNVMQRDRLRSVLLVLQGRETLVVADAVGRSRRFVQRWAYAYRDGGIEAVRKRKAPGRQRRLTPEQEARFVKRVKAGALPGDGVSSLRGPQMRTILDREFGKTFSLNGIAEVDLGLRHRRPSDRVVDARSIPGSEHRNNAEVSRQGSQETRSSRARGDGAGPSRLAHREAAQVAKTNNAAFSPALFPRIESCGTALALVPRARLEQSRLSRRGSADPGSHKKPPFTPSGTSPLHLCHAMGNARESSVTRMSPAGREASTKPPAAGLGEPLRRR